MKTSRLLSLSVADWWSAACAAALMVAFGLAVRLRVFRPTSWPLEMPERGDTRQRESATRLATTVNSVARHVPWPVSCLVRSLVLASMLRHRGIPSCLRIGVRIADGRLEAHAWVEHAGMPVNDAPDIDREFPSFGGDVPAKAFSSR